jgi:hypothetical protein
MRPLILAAFLAVFAVGAAASGVSADGNGSPNDCLGGPSVEGDPIATYDAGAGNQVDGVCIKSGANMFDGNKHSDVLDNGTYEEGCYEVSGVSTQVVTVERLLSGSTCQAISHIDVILSVCGAQCAPCETDCEPCEDPCEPVDPCEEDPGLCEELQNVCIDGQVVEGTADEATNDCDPVRLCVDGESVTVTEFDAESLDGDPGSCVPTEPPPPTTTTPEPTPEPTQEVEAVQEEAPIEEVAALPSAGSGGSGGGSAAWGIGAAALLISLGGVIAVAARPRR